MKIGFYYSDYSHQQAFDRATYPWTDYGRYPTPNNMHMEINMSAICAGKHVLSEKPLSLNTDESQRMLDCLRRYPKVVHGVNFNYRMNPMVQEMKQGVAAGEIGDVMLVHGAYLQDWLMFDTDYNWRLEPSVGGPLRTIADIGSHFSPGAVVRNTSSIRSQQRTMAPSCFVCVAGYLSVERQDDTCTGYPRCAWPSQCQRGPSGCGSTRLA
jgi:hypothetical protein